MVVILALNLVFRVGTFVFGLIQKKQQVSDDTLKANTAAIIGLTTSNQKLESRLKTLEENFTEIPKVKLDLRRMYTAIKMVSGEKWKHIREVIMEDKFS